MLENNMTNAVCVSIMCVGTIFFLPAVLGKDVVLNISSSLDLFVNRIGNYVGIKYFHDRSKILFSATSFLGGLLFWHYWSDSRLGIKYPFVYIFTASIFFFLLAYVLVKFLLSINRPVSTIAIWLIFVIGFLGTLPVLLIPCFVYITVKLWDVSTRSILLFSVLGYLLFIGGVFIFLITNS